MSAAVLTQTDTLDGKFPKILKRLNENLGKENYALSQPQPVEEGEEVVGEEVVIFAYGRPVGNLLVKKSPEGEDYAKRAAIQANILKVNKAKEEEPYRSFGFVVLTYLKRKGRIDKHKHSIGFP
jgi:hypothetical protein